MKAAPTIVWFQKDLRLDDHPALQEGIRRGGPVIPVYIWDPEGEGDWAPGGAARWWLAQSLESLDTDLRRLGSRLVLRRGRSLEQIEDLASSTGARAVYWNRRCEPAVRRRNASIKTALAAGDIEAESFQGNLLFEPGTVRTKAGEPFQVFTPFWKACLGMPEPPLPADPPPKLPAPENWPASMALDALRLEPEADWAAGMRAAWQPGAAGAQRTLESFLAEPVFEYVNERNRPDRRGTSRLSPHLHWGEIGPRRLWHAVRQRAADEAARGRSRSLRGSESYLRQLGWREFAHHLLFHFPETTARPLRTTFENFPWKEDTLALKAWQRGRTGYPIVDAGMRELWHTGWMHNRVRMIVASFLVKDLSIHWLEGAKWFWDTLVDADLANNTLGWQWTAGCGADAAPFFRIFNPVKQGERFDPDGAYVRQWVPELAKLPDKWIHQPWQAPQEVLGAADVELGRTYPRPLVDHAERRRAALAAFASLKANPPGRTRRGAGGQLQGPA